MKKFCESLKEHAKNIIDFENVKILPWTIEELKSHQDAKYVTFVEKESYISSLKIKIIEKLDIIAIIQANIDVEHMVFVTWNLMCSLKSL